MSRTAYRSVCASMLFHCIRPLQPLAMGPKRSSSNSTGKETRIVMRTTMELKKLIIENFEIHLCVSDLAAQYSMTKSMISTFLKNEEMIKAANERRLLLASKGRR